MLSSDGTELRVVRDRMGLGEAPVRKLCLSQESQYKFISLFSISPLIRTSDKACNKIYKAIYIFTKKYICSTSKTNSIHPCTAVNYAMLCRAYDVPPHDAHYFHLTCCSVHVQTFLSGSQGNWLCYRPSKIITIIKLLSKKIMT